MAWFRDSFGRCAENAGKCLTFGGWESSAGRWNAAVWCSGSGCASTHLRKVSGKCGKVPHLRKVGKVRWEVERGCMGFWRRYCVYSPSEGERKTRGKCLTFGRWERSVGRWNAAVWCSGGGTAFTHLRKVCEKCGKVPHLRKVGKVCWEVERGCMGFWRRYCVYSPSEGERKMRESASPSEGGMKRCRCGKE